MHTKILASIVALAALAIVSPAHAKVSPSAAVKTPAVRLQQKGEVFTIKTLKINLLGVRSALGKTYAVLLADTTKLLDKASRPARLGEYKKGNRIRVMGTPADNNTAVINASSIVNESVTAKPLTKKAKK